MFAVIQMVKMYKASIQQTLDIMFLRDGVEFVTSSDCVSRDSADRTLIAWDFQTTAKLSNQIYHVRDSLQNKPWTSTWSNSKLQVLAWALLQLMPENVECEKQCVMNPVEPAYFDSSIVQSQLCVLWCVIHALLKCGFINCCGFWHSHSFFFSLLDLKSVHPKCFAHFSQVGNDTHYHKTN